MVKILVWILLGVVLAVVLYQAIRIRRLVLIGVDLAATAVAYEQHPENPALSILVVGDSSAIGVGASAPGESVAGRLGEYFPTATIQNRGISGQRLADLLVTFDPACARQT